ncbi:hypothetical protein AX769_03855 [Frondihabitans sp. PAMC 28766]|uniref:CGNR zinc finger domain-containing protein n=1 Tax=Frondihabitans sp. PAMC 28766 TaxID=1795630 RepID=UPI00078E815B|nr:CGNR zinc finger domain-containing protein [Frondihabitans sp. PAMC 28766]AMM19433.1 hypothetical protein AX769_03855 [Frondihabitans sp. PAMC 28766]
MVHDEDLLLAVLNSAPVVDGTPMEKLAGHDGAALVVGFGGTGSPSELECLRAARVGLHALVRDSSADGGSLEGLLSKTALRPRVADGRLTWDIQAPDELLLAARAVMAWSRVTEELPGRLRACANPDCNLFLLDRSRPGTAKWCSMATCGNRMKVRAFADRQRTS